MKVWEPLLWAIIANALPLSLKYIFYLTKVPKNDQAVLFLVIATCTALFLNYRTEQDTGRIKAQPTSSFSHLNLGGLEALFARTKKAPRGGGTGAETLKAFCKSPHCIVSILKKTSIMSAFTPWKNFYGRPCWRPYSENATSSSCMPKNSRCLRCAALERLCNSLWDSPDPCCKDYLWEAK